MQLLVPLATSGFHARNCCKVRELAVVMMSQVSVLGGDEGQ